MSNSREEPTITLTRREVELVWDCLGRHVKSGRQRYDNPTFRKLGEIADPANAVPRSPKLRLDEERDAAICRAFDGGSAVSHIASEFGISDRQVGKILLRRDRRNLMGRIRQQAERPPDPSWLTPEWREGFAEELRRAGVLA